jgi:hypothetical protein
MSEDLMSLPKIDQLVERYRGMSEADWNRAFASALTLQARGLFEAAALIRAREEDGQDMEEYRERHREIFEIARSFAYGKAIPELAQYWPDRSLIKLLANLPRPDQERVASGESFPVVSLAADGQLTHYQRTAARMLPGERIIVFGGGAIRTEQEQKDILTSRRTRQLGRKRPEKIGGYVMDYDDPAALIRGGRVPLSVLDEMVRALKRFGHK